VSAGEQAPHRVVDAQFGPWMMREPSGAVEEEMAPGYAARARERARLEREVPDPLERLGSPMEPVRVDEVVYEHGHSREVLPLHGVEARYGPVRAVIAAPGADVDRLVELIRAARRKALGTIAAALYAVEQRIGAEPPPRMPTSGLVPAGALVRRDPLTAGRPGSWEAGDLIDFTWTIGPVIGAAMIHEELHGAAVEIFHRWATGPDGYVEFAETIPGVLAAVTDESVGLSAIAEDWLLDLERVRNWAGSKSTLHGF
jgi:hypothetical protein